MAKSDYSVGYYGYGGIVGQSRPFKSMLAALRHMRDMMTGPDGQPMYQGKEVGLSLRFRLMRGERWHAISPADTDRYAYSMRIKGWHPLVSGRASRSSRASRGFGSALKPRGYINRFRVERVRLDRGGYTKHGRYFGVGQPLYYVSDDAEGRGMYVRANSAREARAEALKRPGHWGGWR